MKFVVNGKTIKPGQKVKDVVSGRVWTLEECLAAWEYRGKNFNPGGVAVRCGRGPVQELDASVFGGMVLDRSEKVQPWMKAACWEAQ